MFCVDAQKNYSELPRIPSVLLTKTWQHVNMGEKNPTTTKTAVGRFSTQTAIGGSPGGVIVLFKNVSPAIIQPQKAEAKGRDCGRASLFVRRRAIVFIPLNMPPAIK